MLCGHFKEGNSKRLELECVSEPLFRKMMLLACGVEGVMAADLDELLQLAALADRFGIPEVRDAVERAAEGRITVGECAALLNAAAGLGLSHVAAACHGVAAAHFDAVAATAEFEELGEEELGRLLDDDALAASCEEEVFRAVLRWMRAGPGGRLRGIALLDKVRRTRSRRADALRRRVSAAAPASLRLR